MEAEDICNRLGLEDVNKTQVSKHVFKNLFIKAARREDEKYLRTNMEGKTKVQDLVTENVSLKSYFKEKSLSSTREMFRIRTNMNKLKGNFKHDKRNADALCVACGKEEEINSHVMYCPSYADLKQGRDMSKNMDLVYFFRDIMKRREKLMKGSQV